tara:strand:- start:943 stop:1413 length:471 start_codon:yes stop_codon:yes gene_type:complete
MGVEHKILEYAINEYGLEKHPCCIPKNMFENLKISFYLWIKKKVSEKLFYFIRDKIWSIKFLDENPNGYIPIIYRHRETKRIVVEFFVERKSDYHNGHAFESTTNNWILSTYDDGDRITDEVVDEEKYKEVVDRFLSRIIFFRPIVREKRINRVLS